MIKTEFEAKTEVPLYGRDSGIPLLGLVRSSENVFLGSRKRGNKKTIEREMLSEAKRDRY